MKWEKPMCSSCSLLWKAKREHFSPVLLNPSQCSASQQPVLEEKCHCERSKGSWNKASSIQYGKMTSELTKNCLHQRLSRCATIRYKTQDEWTVHQKFFVEAVFVCVFCYTPLRAFWQDRQVIHKNSLPIKGHFLCSKVYSCFTTF